MGLMLLQEDFGFDVVSVKKTEFAVDIVAERLWFKCEVDVVAGRLWFVVIGRRRMCSSCGGR